MSKTNFSNYAISGFLITLLPSFMCRCKIYIMVRTQIQLPDSLYRRLKRLAELQETSLAEVLRRAGERELAVHPEIESVDEPWEPPTPRPLGIRKDIDVSEWRTVANDPGNPIER